MKYKFKGQKEVTSIGLYYYGARYYDPATGRFITEDTYTGRIETPQSQNLYVYVMNNPLKYVDPTGHMEITTGALGGDSMPESNINITTNINPNFNNTNLIIPYFNDFNIYLNSVEIDTQIPEYNKVKFEQTVKELARLLEISPSIIKENIVNSTQGASFTVDGVRVIIPLSPGFDMFIKTSRTFNVVEGDGKYSIDINKDTISFTGPQGEIVSGLQDKALDFGVNVGKKFNINLKNGTKIGYQIGFDKMGLNIKYIFDHTELDKTIDNMEVRPLMNKKGFIAYETAVIVSGVVLITTENPKLSTSTFKIVLEKALSY